MALNCLWLAADRKAVPHSSEAEPTLIAQLFAVPLRHLNTEQLTEKQLTRLQLTSHQLTEESAVTDRRSPGPGCWLSYLQCLIVRPRRRSPSGSRSDLMG